MEADLKEFLEKGKKWERIKTSTPGIFIRKMPESSNKPASLAIELNPPDHTGKPTKKNGIFIRDDTDYSLWQELLGLTDITKILQILKKVNPEVGKEKILKL